MILLSFEVAIGGDSFSADKDGDRFSSIFKDSSSRIKLVGFENIDKRFGIITRRKYRKTIDKDTKMLLLAAKPIIIMPQIIKQSYH